METPQSIIWSVAGSMGNHTDEVKAAVYTKQEMAGAKEELQMAAERPAPPGLGGSGFLVRDSRRSTLRTKAEILLDVEVIISAKGRWLLLRQYYTDQ